MMKPDPSEVTCLGVAPGLRKFLNRSSSGEPGGNCGMSWRGGAFRVWEVAILTTLGSSLADRSAKESGAPRAKAGVASNTSKGTAKRRIKRVSRIRGCDNSPGANRAKAGKMRGGSFARERLL